MACSSALAGGRRSDFQGGGLRTSPGEPHREIGELLLSGNCHNGVPDHRHHEPLAATAGWRSQNHWPGFRSSRIRESRLGRGLGATRCRSGGNGRWLKVGLRQGRQRRQRADTQETELASYVVRNRSFPAAPRPRNGVPRIADAAGHLRRHARRLHYVPTNPAACNGTGACRGRMSSQ